MSVWLMPSQVDAQPYSILVISFFLSLNVYEFCLGCWNPSEVDIEEVFKAALACLELGILEPRAQILGGVVIFDLEGFGLQQAWQVTPGVATKVLDLMGVSTKIAEDR